MSAIPSISVIVCSHNSRRDYLERVLASLAAQSVESRNWELILVDSASATPLNSEVDLSWHPHARCVRESEPGLTRARLRGIAESTGDLLVFVDDDNVLDADFLAQAKRIYCERAEIGSWSGATRPAFEEPPPAWTRRYWGNLVIRDVTRDLWSNLPMLPETMPCGAGLCVRRSVAEHYLLLHTSGQRSFALDRSGNTLLSAGDNDLAACACDIGLGVGVFRALRLTHLIPPNRLDEEYLVSLVEGIALSGILLASFRDPAVVKTSSSWRRRVADLARLVLLTRRERRFQRAVRRGEEAARQMLKRVIPSSV